MKKKLHSLMAIGIIIINLLPSISLDAVGRGGGGMRGGGMRSAGGGGRAGGMSRGGGMRGAGRTTGFGRSAGPRSSSNIGRNSTRAGRNNRFNRPGRGGYYGGSGWVAPVATAAVIGGTTAALAGVGAANASRAANNAADSARLSATNAQEAASAAQRANIQPISTNTQPIAPTRSDLRAARQQGRINQTRPGGRNRVNRPEAPPTNVESAASATQNARALRARNPQEINRTINQQARIDRIRGNTAWNNRPHRFYVGGRRAYGFWNDGRYYATWFWGGVPYYWYNGFWTPWTNFWSLYPWWYDFYYNRNNNDLSFYECDNRYDCPDGNNCPPACDRYYD